MRVEKSVFFARSNNRRTILEFTFLLGKIVPASPHDAPFSMAFTKRKARTRLLILFCHGKISKLSAELKLPTWSKPSFACLASRFVYGERITEEKLAMVEKAEDYLMSLGLVQFRVRIHDKLARIEVPPEDIPRLASMASDLNEKLRSLGFLYVSLDLGGYKMGSMNRAIGK